MTIMKLRALIPKAVNTPVVWRRYAASGTAHSQ